ncbi:MAG TPA: hypothetical protein VFQ35_18665 [Polyangiaceae bacterium]|nr:hypothetical protein [Polyangiaceae bacterium]
MSFGVGTQISPPPPGCFKGTFLCAKGSIPASDTAGAGIGWNLAQPRASLSANVLALTGAIKITFVGAKTGTRVALGPSSGDDYCYYLTAAEVSAGAATIPVSSFKSACWDPVNARPYAGEATIRSIQLMVVGSTSGGPATFDFCITDVEPA